MLFYNLALSSLFLKDHEPLKPHYLYIYVCMYIYIYTYIFYVNSYMQVPHSNSIQQVEKWKLYFRVFWSPFCLLV